MLSDWAEIVSARRESKGEGMKKGGCLYVIQYSRLEIFVLKLL